MGKPTLASSGERGIYLKANGIYQVHVSVGGRLVEGGCFPTLAEAIPARDALLVRQKAARMAKAQTNPVERSAAARKDLGMVTHSGITKKRKRCPRFTVQRAAKLQDPVPSRTFSYAEFLARAMAAVAPNSLLYLLRHTPLAAKGAHTRGTIAEAVVRHVLERTGDDVRDRELDSHDLIRVVDGAKRRVEVKAARMTRNRNTWKVVASNVKPKLFDDLVLVFEGLDGMRVYAWGGEGLGGTEHAQDAKKGNVVVVRGDEHVLDPDKAHAALLVNLVAHGNSLLKFVPYDDPAFQGFFAICTKTDQMFALVPLGALQAKSRGDALEVVVAGVLQALGHDVTLPTAGQRSNGDSRGQHAAECDRLVNGVECEIKSCLLAWTDGKDPHFHLQFLRVKAHQHDDRYLAWLTPKALHIWKQPKGNTAGLHGTGSTQHIFFDGPRGRDRITDPVEAEAYFLKKLAFNGLEYVARLDIAPGDFEAYEAAIEAKRAFLGAAGGEAEASDEDAEAEDIASDDTDTSDDASDDDDVVASSHRELLSTLSAAQVLALRGAR